MRKWEEKYNKLKDGKILDESISRLQEKINNRIITKEELKEYENNKKVKENLPKIANVLELKEKIEKELKELKDEDSKRKNLKKMEEENKKLEEEMASLMKEKSKIESDIKSVGNDDKRKTALEGKLLIVNNNIDQNNSKFQKNLETLLGSSKSKSKLQNLSDKQIKAKTTNLSTKVSKINMICNNLIQGKSWDSIDLQLENWQDKSLKSDKKTIDNMRESVKENKENVREDVKENKAKKKQLNDSESFIWADENEDEIESNGEKVTDNKEKSLVAVSNFDQKHPRLAKIKNFFKKVFNKEKLNSKDEKKVDNKDKEKVEVGSKEESDDFRSYIKAVAEKGMKVADKERLENKMKALQEKTVSTEKKSDTGREPGDD